MSKINKQHNPQWILSGRISEINIDKLIRRRKLYQNRLKRAKYPYERINIKDTKNALSEIGQEIKKRSKIKIT